MRRATLEKLRRLTLALAVTVVVASAATYAVRSWRARQLRRAVPAVASDVEQQAQGFTLSRSEAGRTLFVIQASRTIERGGRQTQLEGVSVVVHGREGNRADEIHTGRCAYDASGPGSIYCPDPVTLKLGASGAQSGGAPGESHRLRLETVGVRFDQKSGVARTGERVQFWFPEGEGEAVGLRYQPAQPALVLERAVEIVLRTGPNRAAHVRGRRAEFDSRLRRFSLQAPLELRADGQRLQADELALYLDSAYRLERLEARGRVLAQTEKKAGSERAGWQLRAEQAAAEFSPGRDPERIILTRQVHWESEGERQDVVRCQRAEIHFDPATHQVKRVTAQEDAYLRSAQGGEVRELAAERMELGMRPDGHAERLQTHARGVLSLRRAGGTRQQIEADQIELHFAEEGRLQGLAAEGGVEVSWHAPGEPPRRSQSAELRGEFDARSELAWIEQWGGFRYQDAEGEATAGRARYDAARSAFVLTENPVLWDETLRLSAQRVELGQREARLMASGAVRATYAGSAASQFFGSGLPVHIAAEHVEGERGREAETDWVRYSGHARLWQGGNRLAAAAIEISKSRRQLTASGDVSSLFVENRAPSATSAARLTRITSQRLEYFEAERRALYEGTARAEGSFGILYADRLEVFLATSETADGRRIQRVRGSGHVVIENSSRRAESEEAEYIAATETLVLWGGAPQLSDAEHNVVRGTRLTFNLADDKITVESGTGSRTVTRRLWSQ